ncbi:hypothetical protein BOX15_Mlig013519g1, partial [Macrostomum lignano]
IMIISNVKVSTNYEKTCTCKLSSSQHISASLVKNGIVYASIDAKVPAFVACSVACVGTVPSSVLSIPNYLFKKLHLNADDFVTLTVIDPSTVPLLSSVSLDATSFDLDVLRKCEAELEQGFLLQCSFVYLGMQLPVWCGGQLVYCTVENFHPISIENKFGRLGISTTLHLNCRQHGQFSGGRAVGLGNGLATPGNSPTEAEPAAEEAALPVAGDEDSAVRPAWLPGILWKLADFVCRWLIGHGLGIGQLLRLRAACRRCVGQLTNGPAGVSPASSSRPSYHRPLLLQARAVPEASDRIAEPNCGLVSPRHLRSAGGSRSASWCLVEVQLLGPQESAVMDESSAKAGGPLLLKLLPCDSVPADCLQLTPACAAALGIACGSWLRLVKPRVLQAETAGSDVTSDLIKGCIRLKELRLSGKADKLHAAKQALEGFIRTRTADNPALILGNRKLAFTEDSGVHHACLTELIFHPSSAKQQQPPQLPFALLCRELGPRLGISTVESAAVNDQDGDGGDNEQLPDWLADALEPLVSQLFRQFTAAVAGPSRLSCLTLFRDDSSGGGGGSGKTALLCRFASRLRRNGFHAGDAVDCRRLARLEFASARRRLWRSARLAAARAPAGLLLDNLDAACAPVEDGQVGTGAEVQLVRLCHLIRSLLKWARHQPGLMLLATAGGPINSQLIDSAAGQCLFDTDSQLDIRLSPTGDMRRLLTLSADGADSASRQLTLGEFARCKRILEYCSPDTAARLQLEVALGAVRQARDECNPARAQLPLEYDQICGLDSAKAVLERAIIWPLRFPRLVQRVRGGAAATAGVLLTGPSGCGKSMLVMALARHLRLRLLAVRGPELLSKFVGASERAVRDLFAKARRLQPCLVFLDEVDALAPRRGNDSTGVTDQVVNQLLTELDGLDSDGLAGVALLAATNRPDLVDPALLRPGRIGLRAVCQLPGREDRRSIIDSLLTADGFAELADKEQLLDRIADSTEGFCSADFNALLLAAAAEASADSCCYGQSELLAALDRVRPSLLSVVGGESAASPTALQPGRRVMFA